MVWAARLESQFETSPQIRDRRSLPDIQVVYPAPAVAIWGRPFIMPPEDLLGGAVRRPIRAEQGELSARGGV